MSHRRHHNNDGLRQIRRGKTREQVDRMSERVTGERRYVEPNEFDRRVRFEIETVDGWIIRYTGEEAEAHCAALDAACALAGERIAWPSVPPEVFKK